MNNPVKRDIIDELQHDWAKQRPDLDPKSMGVVLRIQTLAKILGNRASEKLQQFGLQWWQYDVMAALRRQGAPFIMPATDLAEAVMLTSGAMTNRIDRLENEGLVRRIKDENDLRRVLVQLTKGGLTLIEEATEARFETAAEALAGLTEDQRAALSDLLRLVLTTQEA